MTIDQYETVAAQPESLVTKVLLEVQPRLWTELEVLPRLRTNATMGNARLPDQRVGRATPPPQTCERRNKQMEEQRNRVQRASDKTRRRF